MGRGWRGWDFQLPRFYATCRRWRNWYDAELVRWWPHAVRSTLHPHHYGRPHQTLERHHLFVLVLVYILIRIQQMGERRAFVSIMGRVHSRATPAFVNTPENGTIPREWETQPFCHSFPTGTLLGKSTMPVDFVLRIWQVDLIIAPFRVPFVVNHKTGVPAFVSCILDVETDGRCKGSTTGNVYWTRVEQSSILMMIFIFSRLTLSPAGSQFSFLYFSNKHCWKCPHVADVNLGGPWVDQRD